MSVAPSLTFKAIAVLSGAVAFPFAATDAAVRSASGDPGNGPVTTAAARDTGSPAPDDDDEIPGQKYLLDNSRQDAPEESDSQDAQPRARVGDQDEFGPAEDAAADDDDEVASVPSRDRPEGTDASVGTPEEGCLSRTICAIKEKIRWQTPAWTPTQCHHIATAVLTSAKRYAVSPSLLLAVMINESDLNEKAARVSMRENKIYAKDSGLMAIRCVLGKRDRCLNGNVRGLTWTNVMNPTTNIDLGAKELAYWKNGGAVTRTIVKVRDASGRVRPVYKTVPCRHKDHAYWAHYNHGPRYIDHGFARHYPHRVAVLDHALAAVLNVDTPELRGAPVTMRDPGKRQRTADRPLEPRYRKLCSQIQSVGTCSTVASN